MEPESPQSPASPSRLPRGTLASVSVVCALMGAMMGASALGAARTNARSSSVFAGRSLTRDAVGVWRDIAVSEQVPTVNEWIAEAMASLDVEAHRAERPQGRRRTSSGGGGGGGGVTSDHVPAGPAQGYVDGRATRITVTRLDGKPVEVRTAMAFERMRAAAARDRVTLRIVSGFRTMEHQQALYAAFRRGRGNLAARPGESNHQSGHALDLNTSSPGVLAWLNRNGARFGFRRTVPSENWHWEWW